MSARHYVFGYGSLAAAPGSLSRSPAEHGWIADLHGFARCFGVAMDNARDLPAYKHYRRPDGTRPAVFVAFLDLVEQAGARVNGVCLPVDEDELAALDVRERNYVRREVTDLIRPGTGATVWTYVGSPESRERLQRGRAEGRAVISAEYLARVRAAFAALGGDELDALQASVAGDAALPVWELERIDTT